MIGMLFLGLYMHENKAYDLYPIHKSIGTLMLPLVCFRAIWRILKGWPEPTSPLHFLLHMAAKVSHFSLLALTISLPISGVLMSALSGRGIHIFSFTLMAGNYNTDGKLIALSETGASFFHQAHFLLSDALIWLTLIHLGAALVHHFWLKDQVLNRMLGLR